MAIWYARLATNVNAANVWNSAANGSGSWLTWPPASGDVLMANGFNVTVNVNTDLGATGQVRTDTANGATAGGRFTVANGITLTANVYAGSTQCVVSSAASGAVVGNVFGGSASAAYGVNNAGTGTFTITGNVAGGSVSNAAGVANSSSGTINITGNLSMSVNNAQAVNNISTGTVNVTGDVAGSTVAGAQAGTAWNTSTGAFNITGNVTGDAGWGAYQFAAGTLTISGYAQASSTSSAVNNNGLGTVTIGETRSASNGRGAVTGAFRYASTTALVHKPIASDGSTLTMKPVGAFTLPNENVVRKGVAYGADKVGTLVGASRHHRMAA